MRILIIGAGSVTRSMIKSALKFSWFRELSIVDPNSKSIEHLRAHFPNLTFQEFTNIDEALSSSSYDSVWINTPSHLHYAAYVSFSVNNKSDFSSKATNR